MFQYNLAQYFTCPYFYSVLNSFVDEIHQLLELLFHFQSGTLANFILIFLRSRAGSDTKLYKISTFNSEFHFSKVTAVTLIPQVTSTTSINL